MNTIKEIFGLEKGIEVTNLLFRNAVFMLLTIKNNQPIYISQLSKLLDMTYCNTMKILRKLEKLDIVLCMRVGRVVRIRLTEKGEKLVECFKPFGEILTTFRRLRT